MVQQAQPFRALRVDVVEDRASRQVTEVGVDILPEHDVTIRVQYSSLNYKDALSASGNRGVTKSYPHTPGIDAAGVVEASRDSRFQVGDNVIVTGYDLGGNTPGGFGQYIRVPGDWVVPLPAGLGAKEAMILGTAGLTAALSVSGLIRHEISPDDGPVLVTGATGGVGCLAISLLAKCGYRVSAGTGKQDAQGWLKELGAAEVLGREELAEPDKRPLLSSRWAGAVDTVGGSTLDRVVKTLKIGGAVAACGNVAGAALDLTAYPFILRGVSLIGVTSQHCPMHRRLTLWQKLAGEWRIGRLDLIAEEVGLERLDERIEAILRGAVRGRVLVNLDS